MLHTLIMIVLGTLVVMSMSGQLDGDVRIASLLSALLGGLIMFIVILSLYDEPRAIIRSENCNQNSMQFYQHMIDNIHDHIGSMSANDQWVKEYYWVRDKFQGRIDRCVRNTKHYYKRINGIMSHVKMWGFRNHHIPEHLRKYVDDFELD